MNMAKSRGYSGQNAITEGDLKRILAGYCERSEQ